MDTSAYHRSASQPAQPGQGTLALFLVAHVRAIAFLVGRRWVRVLLRRPEALQVTRPAAVEGCVWRLAARYRESAKEPTCGGVRFVVPTAAHAQAALDVETADLPMLLSLAASSRSVLQAVVGELQYSSTMCSWLGWLCTLALKCIGS